MTFNSSNNLYGFPTPLTRVFPAPILSQRAPTTADYKYPIGQQWVDELGEDAYVLVNVTANVATWNVTATTPGNVDTLTGNSGGAISPSAGNINVLGGSLANFVGSGHTLTLTPIAGAYPTTPFVVGTIGEAGYQTIQSAVNAANSAGGGIIVVQPGTYIEDLTLFNGCHITGLTFADAGGGVMITGQHTPPTSGGFVFNNVQLTSSTNIFNSAAAGSAHLVLGNAEIFVTNGYTFNLPNWTGKLESFDVNAAVGTADGYVNNTGGSEVDIFECSVGSNTTNPMIVSGFTLFAGANVYCPIQFRTGANVQIDYSHLGGALTFSNNSFGSIVTTHIATGAAAAITMSSSGNWSILTSIVDSSNNPAIAGAGAGTITLGDVTFPSNASLAGTLTVAYSAMKTGALTVGSGGAAITGTTTINNSGSAVTTIGTGGTGAVNIGNATGNTAVTGSLTASTTLTATLGAITATNGNVVLGTAGNKILSTSVASTTTAGANSFGTVALSSGAATVNTSAALTASIIILTTQALGTVATPMPIAVTARSNGVSFTITSSDGTDTSSIGWMIIN